MSRPLRKVAPWSPSAPPATHQDAPGATRRPWPLGFVLLPALFLAWCLRRVLAVGLVLVLGPWLVVLMLWYALRYGSPLGQGFRLLLRGPGRRSPPTERSASA